jgi:hypothetical protein
MTKPDNRETLRGPEVGVGKTNVSESLLKCR